MKDFMLLLKAESNNNGAIPEFVQTHPLPDSRIETIEAFIKEQHNLPNSSFTSDAFNKLKASTVK